MDFNLKCDKFQRKIFELITNDFNILDNFYSPYSIIRDIDINNKKIGEINTLVKQCLYPTIYSIIGKRYSGKTELSKVLEEKMGMTLLNFNAFLREPEIKERVKENNNRIRQLNLKNKDKKERRNDDKSKDKDNKTLDGYPEIIEINLTENDERSFFTERLDNLTKKNIMFKKKDCLDSIILCDFGLAYHLDNYIFRVALVLLKSQNCVLCH